LCESRKCEIFWFIIIVGVSSVCGLLVVLEPLLDDFEGCDDLFAVVDAAGGRLEEHAAKELVQARCEYFVYPFWVVLRHSLQKDQHLVRV
jgi:hypothetical protein